MKIFLPSMNKLLIICIDQIKILKALWIIFLLSLIVLIMILKISLV